MSQVKQCVQCSFCASGKYFGTSLLCASWPPGGSSVLMILEFLPFHLIQTVREHFLPLAAPVHMFGEVSGLIVGHFIHIEAD